MGTSNEDEKVSKSRLDLYEKSYVLNASLSRIRKRFDIDVMTFEEDLIQSSPVDDRNVGVVTHSNWYCSLSEKRERKLIEAIALELQRLELPLTLIESYLEALLYGGKLKDPMMPTYYTYFTSMLKDSFPAHYTTEDKKWLSWHFKHIFKINRRGRLPEKQKEVWDVIKRVVLGKRSGKQVRRLRNMKAKNLAFKEKGLVVEREEGGDVMKQKRQTDLGLVAEAYEDEDGSDDKKHAQNIRKHRGREKKRQKRLLE